VLEAEVKHGCTEEDEACEGGYRRPDLGLVTLVAYFEFVEVTIVAYGAEGGGGLVSFTAVHRHRAGSGAAVVDAGVHGY
jgi:hypothetical protein